MHFCGACLKKKSAALRCARCKRIFYCNKKCQKRHWRRAHKMQCHEPGSPKPPLPPSHPHYQPLCEEDALVKLPPCQGYSDAYVWWIASANAENGFQPQVLRHGVENKWPMFYNTGQMHKGSQEMRDYLLGACNRIFPRHMNKVDHLVRLREYCNLWNVYNLSSPWVPQWDASLIFVWHNILYSWLLLHMKDGDDGGISKDTRLLHLKSIVSDFHSYEWLHIGSPLLVSRESETYTLLMTSMTKDRIDTITKDISLRLLPTALVELIVLHDFVSIHAAKLPSVAGQRGTLRYKNDD